MNAAIKLICYGCLAETPAATGVVGAVRELPCKHCRAIKRHVVRAANFVARGFQTKPGQAYRAAEQRGLGSNWSF